MKKPIQPANPWMALTVKPVAAKQQVIREEAKRRIVKAIGKLSGKPGK